MPVPDQVRDDGSGIQKHTIIKQHWIPGQARNDNTAAYAVLSITTQAVTGIANLILVDFNKAVMIISIEGTKTSAYLLNNVV